MNSASELFLEQREHEASQQVTLEQVHGYINDLKQGVLDGERDAILAYNELKEIGDNSSLSQKEIKSAVIEEAESYGKKRFVHKGFEVERRAGRKNWSYKEVPEWIEKDQEKKELEKALQARYELHQRGEISVSEETGEPLPIPVLTYSEDSISIKPVK